MRRMVQIVQLLAGFTSSSDAMLGRKRSRQRLEMGNKTNDEESDGGEALPAESIQQSRSITFELFLHPSYVGSILANAPDGAAWRAGKVVPGQRYIVQPASNPCCMVRSISRTSAALQLLETISALRICAWLR